MLIIHRVLKNPEQIPDLDLLETVLAYRFKDRALLERAITHRSWAHEKVAPGDELEARKLHNESLEFLGDSVLGLIVANYLCGSYPGGTEGELSRMKHRLVSAPTLAKASQELNLGERNLCAGFGVWIIVGNGVERAVAGDEGSEAIGGRRSDGDAWEKTRA